MELYNFIDIYIYYVYKDYVICRKLNFIRNNVFSSRTKKRLYSHTGKCTVLQKSWFICTFILIILHITAVSLFNYQFMCRTHEVTA